MGPPKEVRPRRRKMARTSGAEDLGCSGLSLMRSVEDRLLVPPARAPSGGHGRSYADIAEGQFRLLEPSMQIVFASDIFLARFNSRYHHPAGSARRGWATRQVL
jgi:hypothetical protein